MKVLQRQDHLVFDQHSQTILSQSNDFVPVGLSLRANAEEQANLLASIISVSTVSRIGLEANEFRCSPHSKAKFRQNLMKELRKGWTAVGTEARFIRLVEILQRDGCAIFAGLIDNASFRQLIDEFTSIMSRSGSQAFLHSFAHLTDYPAFFQNAIYSDAVIHPLLIAAVSYAMGGPIRMVDARGKDTQPISVNAQDNMLHIDNTPFREEYKVLLGWERGQVKGPTGQNFTFLPGTHKGNRSIRTDGQAQPWSTENDSLFITANTIESVFEFQKDITGCEPKVVEVVYPEQPITVVFSAGSLVHHRYRNENGSTRSCVIVAFHLASDHPGALIQSTGGSEPKSITDMLLSYQNGTEAATFCALLGARASAIESKISEILDRSHQSTLVDTKDLVLSGEKLDHWRKIVINAPSTTKVKFEGGNFLSYADNFISRDLLVEKLAAAMAYDKHGLLDLIIYLDGHEEIRKPARKSIWTMPKERIAEIVTAWLPAVEGH